ncbi:translation initiation factor eIF-2B epsilon subunit, GEF [Coemansia javaensis]|uniref:Translation initiation factor eIF2B subunit epsilon n=1 Tax=Coemansia javaensis TaxID=2761396 RepID=A0A9W8LKT1_9FUNG|nr:translation initiation factor eIF-2B epsilon subunit, GEF [Coemansia javaensis]
MDAGRKNSGLDGKEEELKAVVLADLFREHFQPLTLGMPYCLLPLCNVPMIEYTLDFLAQAGVEETIVVCTEHADALVAYIKRSRWAPGHASMRVVVRAYQNASTVGDALRTIDSASTVPSDFILCTGMVVSNVNLAQLVAAHLASRKQDPNHIMTMVLQEMAPAHRRRDKSDESVYFIEPGTGKLLALSSHHSVPRARSITVSRAAISKHPEVELRADLTDTNVYVCSLGVLALFTENFDYHSMRRHFISGILDSDIQALQAHAIYAHVLDGASSLPPGGPAAGPLPADNLLSVPRGGYVATVTDTAAYDAISRDVVGRWAYPLCPDNGPCQAAVYSYTRGAVYKAPSVRLDRESHVKHHAILGPRSHVASHARVSDSVLGAGCVIGKRSTIRGSYLLDGVRVGCDSVVERAILGARVTVLDNVVIERGCIIGDDVAVGPNVRIPAFTRLARRKRHRGAGGFGVSSDESDDFDSDGDSNSDSDSDGSASVRSGSAGRTGAAAAATASAAAGHLSPGMDSGSQELFDRQALGAEGVGYVWSESPLGPGAAGSADSASDSDEDGSSCGGGGGGGGDADYIVHQLRQLHTIGSTLDDMDQGNSEHEYEYPDDADSDQEVAAPALSSHEEYERELYLTIKRACDENLPISEVGLEVNSLRMSYKKDVEAVRASVVQAILRLIDLDSLRDSAKAVLEKWGSVIAVHIGDGREQLDLLDIFERYCALEDGIEDAARSRLFVRIVFISYQLDILEDVAIVAWYGRAQKKASTEVSPDLLRVLEPIVNNLNESDDDDDDDSDEDYSGEDDSGEDSSEGTSD